MILVTEVHKKNPQNLMLIGFMGRFKSLWDYLLVEVAGIEPASASTPPSALHAYPITFSLISGYPIG